MEIDILAVLQLLTFKSFHVGMKQTWLAVLTTTEVRNTPFSGGLNQGLEFRVMLSNVLVSLLYLPLQYI